MKTSNASETLVPPNCRFSSVPHLFFETGLTLDTTATEIVLADPHVLTCAQVPTNISFDFL